MSHPVFPRQQGSGDGESMSEAEKALLRAKIIDEAEVRVQQELAKPPRDSIIPDTLSDLVAML